jgi:hypothetical protein
LALAQTQQTVAIEGNSSGQLEILLRAQTGRTVDAAIRKYDGRAFTPEYILAHLPEEV